MGHTETPCSRTDLRNNQSASEAKPEACHTCNFRGHLAFRSSMTDTTSEGRNLHHSGTRRAVVAPDAEDTLKGWAADMGSAVSHADKAAGDNCVRSTPAREVQLGKPHRYPATAASGLQGTGPWAKSGSVARAPKCAPECACVAPQDATPDSETEGVPVPDLDTPTEAALDSPVRHVPAKLPPPPTSESWDPDSAGYPPEPPPPTGLDGQAHHWGAWHWEVPWEVEPHAKHLCPVAANLQVGRLH